MGILETRARAIVLDFAVVLGFVLAPAVFGACEGSSSKVDAEAARTRTPTTASPTATLAAPTREGCARTGALDGVETDPACIVARADDGVTREAMKQIVLELTSDPSSLMTGGTSILTLAIVNRGTAEAEIVLEAQPQGAGPRPDWSRLAGVPELRPTSLEGYHLFMPVRTLDANDRSVDGLPSMNAPGSSGSPRLLRVRLKPGGKLTRTFSWWALRIPTPYPIFRDDAGHRIVPKTAPLPLQPGEYTVVVDVPLHGVSAAEAAATTRVQVEKSDAKPPRKTGTAH